jgi:hypothetical protein
MNTKKVLGFMLIMTLSFSSLVGCGTKQLTAGQDTSTEQRVNIETNKKDYVVTEKGDPTKSVDVPDVIHTIQVGDSIRLKYIKFTINKTLIIPNTSTVKAKEGKEFFAVDCTVENITTNEKVISSVMMFKVVDSDGRECKQSLLADADGKLDGRIGSGRKISGQYVVQADKGAKGLELEFKGSLLVSGTVVVELN